MKLVTYSPLPSGNPRPGLLLDDKRIVDIPAALGADDDTATMLGIIRGGRGDARAACASSQRKPPARAVALADVKLHAPIPRPPKNVFCVGWNYLEHFEEGAKKLQDDRELPEAPGVLQQGADHGERSLRHDPLRRRASRPRSTGRWSSA